MRKFRYNLDLEGNVTEFGFLDFENELDGTEPFTGFDIQFYKKDMSTGEWIYLPDVTPVDKNIIDVKYDWQQMKAYITIADQFRPGPHEFDCDSDWTTDDCQNAINSKFNIE